MKNLYMAHRLSEGEMVLLIDDDETSGGNAERFGLGVNIPRPEGYQEGFSHKLLTEIIFYNFRLITGIEGIPTLIKSLSRVTTLLMLNLFIKTIEVQSVKESLLS